MTKWINTWAASTEVQSDFDLGPKSSSDEQWAPKAQHLQQPRAPRAEVVHTGTSMDQKP